MRKLYFKGLLASLLLLISANVSAYDIEVDGIYYNLDVSTLKATVTSGTNEYMGTINIPNTFEYRARTFSVTSIGEAAFKGCKRLSAVTIGENVDEIGGAAFSGSGLTSIKIPDGICKIETSAFSGCAMLTSITIPSSVTELGDCSFSGCTKLSSLTLPNSIEKIGESAFEDCRGLLSFKIPNGVEKIYYSTFKNCSNLKSVDIPNSVTDIGGYAFYGCGLTSLTIPNSVVDINSRALYNCSGLTSLTIPSSVIRIGSEVFYGCKGLTDLTIEESEEGGLECYPDPDLFISCPIKTLYLGRTCYYSYYDGSERKKNYDLFSNLSTLKSVTIGRMGYIEAFMIFDPLENLTIEDAEEPLKVETKSGAALPNFYSKVPVENMYINRNYSYTWEHEVGWYGYRYVTYVNFKIANPVKNVTLGGNCTSVGESQFSDIKELTSVTIGDSIAEIKKLAFYGCSGLTSIYSTNLTPCELNETAFENMHYLTSTLYVPIGALEAYQNAEGWKNFFDIREFDPTGIEGVKTDTLPTAIYTLSGKKVSEPQKGQIYIFRYGNGKTVKKLVK